MLKNIKIPLVEKKADGDQHITREIWYHMHWYTDKEYNTDIPLKKSEKYRQIERRRESV